MNQGYTLAPLSCRRSLLPRSPAARFPGLEVVPQGMARDVPVVPALPRGQPAVPDLVPKRGRIEPALLRRLLERGQLLRGADHAENLPIVPGGHVPHLEGDHPAVGGRRVERPGGPHASLKGSPQIRGCVESCARTRRSPLRSPLFTSRTQSGRGGPMSPGCSLPERRRSRRAASASRPSRMV